MALLWLCADATEIKIHSEESNLILALFIFFSQTIISLFWTKQKPAFLYCHFT